MSAPNHVDLHTGNIHDDDAFIIDDNVREVDTPPTPVMEPITGFPLTEPIRCTRMMTRHDNLDPAWDRPTLMLPADANRKFLYIRVTSPTAVATDFVYIADELAKLQATFGNAARLFHGQFLPLENHTGPILATSAGSSAPMSVDIWSVTE